MTSEKSHLDRIDVLRAVAILLVYFCHALPNVTGRNKYEALGHGGVSLFFVISGFCIHHSYLRHQERSADTSLKRFTWQFLWRRFWRIYPPYVVVLILTWWLVQRQTSLPAWHFWSHAFLFHNTRDASFYSINPAFWSLAVEWQFYLMYPAFLWCCRRWSTKKALLAAAAVSLALRGLALLWQDWREAFSPAVWFSPLILFFDWSLGVWLAERWRQGKPSRHLELAALPMLVLFPLTSYMTVTRPFGFTLAAIGFAGMMSFYLRRPRALTLLEKALVPIGICSYSFYLFHFPLIGRMGFWFRRAGVPDSMVWNAILYSVVILSGLIALSWISFKLLEKPGIACGKSLWARWAERPAAPKPQPVPVLASNRSTLE